MPNQQTLFNLFILIKFVLWIAVIVIATILLRRRKVTLKVRLAFLIGGMLLFGFAFGLGTRQGINPNPVFSVRNLLTFILTRQQFIFPVVMMLVILLLMVWLSNTVRIIAFMALVTSLVVAGLDWIRVIDPFKLF